MKWVTPVLVVFVVLVALCGGSWYFFGANVMKLFEISNPMLVGDSRPDDAGVRDAGGDYY